MSDVDTGGMFSAREVLTTLLSSFNRSTNSSAACNWIAIKDMLINKIIIFNNVTLVYNHYYSIDKIAATVRCISNNRYIANMLNLLA